MAAAAVVAAALCVASRMRSARKPIRQAHLRGRSLRKSAEVAEILGGARLDRDAGIVIGRQRFPSEVAARHLAFIGTTGSGKTLLQRLLMQSTLPGIGRGHGQRAVIYDAKQDILSILAGMRLSCPIQRKRPNCLRSIRLAAWVKLPTSPMRLLF